MFLSMLTDEEKKELFLELCIYTSNADGVLHENEKKVMEEYCVEMRYKNDDMRCNHTIADVITLLSEKCSNVEKRIIMIELEGLILADYKRAEEEQYIFSTLANQFGMSLADVEEIKSLVKKCVAVYDEMVDYITMK